MYLVDTNIWLGRLLDQDRSEEVGRFLAHIPADQLRMDVLYISFQRPQQATDTEMTEDGILLRYRGNHLVGMTIPDAAARAIS